MKINIRNWYIKNNKFEKVLMVQALGKMGKTVLSVSYTKYY